MPQVNTDQLMSLLRTVLQIIGTGLVSHGTLGINGAMWEQISGGVLMIAPVIWSMLTHSDASKIKAVAAMPDVAQIVVKPDAKDGAAAVAADPNLPKVVTQ